MGQSLASEIAGLVGLKVLHKTYTNSGTDTEAIYSFASGFFSELARTRMLQAQVVSTRSDTPNN